MADESHSFHNSEQSNGVTIGDVEGGIHDTTIAGRDVIHKITQVFAGGMDQQRAQRNRRAMLKLVSDFWVKGVLEQSLHGAAMIELGLEERPAAVERPWGMVLQTSDQPNRLLPPGISIVDVFHEMNCALLILGKPGSGKTTMLLELARDTIARAKQDVTQPIPVVLNLSSWARNRRSIAHWLVEELNAKYYVPKNIARRWVENSDLLLLLDGLDEVKTQLRAECVEAINEFRQEHGFTPLVICSRTADYEALTARLTLQGAVVLQPLTPEQVDQYLDRAGSGLAAVRETLERDAPLKELAQSPLMLSIMTLAYRGIPAKDLRSPLTTEARRRHVFDAYVQQMFKRRGVDMRYSPEDTIRWLGWLAQRMAQHAETLFIIERLQPTWLGTPDQQRLYSITSRVTTSVLVGLVAGLSFGLLSELLTGWLPLALVRFLGASITPGSGLQDWLASGMTLGLMTGLAFALAGLLIGLVIGLTSIEKSASECISLIDAVEWSWSALFSEIKNRSRIWLRNLRTPGALSDFFAVQYLTTQLISALPIGLSGIVTDDPMDLRRGLRQSMRHALVVGLAGMLYGIAAAFFFELVRSLEVPLLVLVQAFSQAPAEPALFRLTTWVQGTAAFATILGVAFALIAALRFGG